MKICMKSEIVTEIMNNIDVTQNREKFLLFSGFNFIILGILRDSTSCRDNQDRSNIKRLCQRGSETLFDKMLDLRSSRVGVREFESHSLHYTFFHKYKPLVMCWVYYPNAYSE
jgi:hypothetical protein